MSAQHRAQPFQPHVVEPTRPEHVALRPDQLIRTDTACDYLCYRGPHRLNSLYKFLKRRGIKTARRGRTVLIRVRDLDRAIGATPERG